MSAHPTVIAHLEACVGMLKVEKGALIKQRVMLVNQKRPGAFAKQAEVEACQERIEEFLEAIELLKDPSKGAGG